MRSRSVALTFVTLAIAACGTDGAAPGPSVPPASAAYVVRSGFSIRDEQIGTGALVRVRGQRAVREIRLRVSMFANGRRVTVERAELPYCPPSTDCLWAEALFGEHLGRNWRDVDRVRVEVVGDGGRMTGSHEVGRLDLEEQEAHVTVTPEGEEGTAYLVALRDSAPAFGVSFFVGDGDRRPLRYSQTLFPRRQGDRVVAVFYPGPVPPSVHGPQD
jgi:hypothetical protein